MKAKPFIEHTNVKYVKYPKRIKSQSFNIVDYRMMSFD